MEEIIYVLCIFSYTYFITSLVLTFFFGNIDLDVDLDGDIDCDFSAILSFKGFIHFLMGFSSYLSYCNYTLHSIEMYDYLGAFLLGIFFMFILGLSYIICMKANYVPEQLTGEQLIGKTAKVTLFRKSDEEYYYYYASCGTLEIFLKSKHKLVPGEEYIINNFINNYYLV